MVLRTTFQSLMTFSIFRIKVLLVAVVQNTASSLNSPCCNRIFCNISWPDLSVLRDADAAWTEELL